MRQLLSRLLRRNQGVAGVEHEPSAYVHRLLGEFHRFVLAEHGRAAMPRDEFLALFWQLQRSSMIRPVNRFIGDLWNLFGPDFRDRLDDYYKSQELQLTMTFLAYAAQPALLNDNYIAPYRIMRERTARGSVLEVGAGIPHGFLSGVFDEGAAWCSELTIVDLDAVYSRFVRWCCETRGVGFKHVCARAGQAPALPADGAYDFVFAKDVFEHLDDPLRTIRDIVRVAKPASLLALDLEDKGAVEYQHISPALAHLRQDVLDAGFRVRGTTGNMTLFERGS